MRNNSLYLTIIGLLLFNLCFAINMDKIRLQELITEWESRDGADALELGPMITKELILNDNIFFEMMLDNISTFNSWLKDLQYHTFTIFNIEDEVDKILKKTMLLKLKELMVEHSEKYKNDIKYGDMAQRLINRLRIIDIEAVE